jgi:hypothetical protein
MINLLTANIYLKGCNNDKKIYAMFKKNTSSSHNGRESSPNKYDFFQSSIGATHGAWSNPITGLAMHVETVVFLPVATLPFLGASIDVRTWFF